MRCHFYTYGLSAHTDRMQMIALLESLRPRTIILVHGDQSSKESLADGLSCRDIIPAENGMEITRSYRVRDSLRKDAGRTSSRGQDIDISAARNLLGPPGKVPIRAHEAVQAWFGERVGREVVEEFIGRLESIGIIRRDDESPSLLWVLGPDECDLHPEEAALAVKMKEENPKGRLLEWSARERNPNPPAF